MDSRIKFIVGLSFFIILSLAIYLFILQTFDPFNLDHRKLERYDEHKEFIMANRGSILDCNGTILVNTKQYYQVDIDVNKLNNMAKKNKISVTEYYKQISEIFSMNTTLTTKEVYDKLLNTKSNTIVISYNIDQNQLKKTSDQMRNAGFNVLIPVFNSSKRVYAKGTMAARLLGLTKGRTDNTSFHTQYSYKLEGQNGIEKSYDADLIGDYGWRKMKKDARQYKIPIPNMDTKPVIHGSSIYLTINSEIQEILENNLTKGLNQYKAKNAIGVIMNPNNGDIIAMAGINENDNKISDNQLRGLSNMPTQFLFEPGSTLKPFVSLLAIEKDLVKETDMFDCRTWKLPKRTIRDSHELGTISFRDIIVHSSNVGISKIADIIGNENLYQHYTNLGFGSSTNVNLIDEYSGRFSKLSDWSQFTLHSISFGQEISMTPLQLANAYCVLANGGELLKPNIIKKKKDINGKYFDIANKRVIRAISSKNAIQLNNGFLYDVVERGTGMNTRFENIKIAGKTGTSEKAVDGKYSTTKYIASFAGFFPYENPAYVMVIIFDEPDYRYRFGSSSAVPTFKNVLEEMLTLPDCSIISEMKTNNHKVIIMPQLTGFKTEDAKKILKNKNIDYQIFNEDNGVYVVKQYPQAGVHFTDKNIVSLYCSNNEDEVEITNMVDKMTMPNLVGLSLRQAIHLSKILKINLIIKGNGHIVSQSVKAGENLNYQQKCVVVAN